MFDIKSQYDFIKRIRQTTKGKRSHILFLKEIPMQCLKVYVAKDLLKVLELSDDRKQYYITDKFVELTNHLE